MNLYNTDVSLWAAKKDGFLLITHDGDIIQNGEVLGRFACRHDSEMVLRAAGWELAVSMTRDNKPLWVKT